MPYRQILEWPNSALKEKASIVDNFLEAKSIAKDLEDTLVVKKGAGLAAPQIGHSKRIMVIDCSVFGVDFVNPESESSFLSNKNMWVLVNPEINGSEGKIEWHEGCLSVPWHNARVERHEKISASYQTVEGERKEITLDFPLSAAFQHEMDHLEGKLYLDRISGLASSRIKNSIKKKRKKLISFKKEMLSMNNESSVKSKRVKKNSHLSKKELKKRRSHKRASR